MLPNASLTWGWFPNHLDIWKCPCLKCIANKSSSLNKKSTTRQKCPWTQLHLQTFTKTSTLQQPRSTLQHSLAPTQECFFAFGFNGAKGSRANRAHAFGSRETEKCPFFSCESKWFLHLASFMFQFEWLSWHHQMLRTPLLLEKRKHGQPTSWWSLCCQNNTWKTRCLLFCWQSKTGWSAWTARCSSWRHCHCAFNFGCHCQCILFIVLPAKLLQSLGQSVPSKMNWKHKLISLSPPWVPDSSWMKRGPPWEQILDPSHGKSWCQELFQFQFQFSQVGFGWHLSFFRVRVSAILLQAERPTVARQTDRQPPCKTSEEARDPWQILNSVTESEREEVLVGKRQLCTA